ncbi:hypothetical protein [Actinoplanes sp. NPDC049681]|uniref:hypothetical protein n=1 Tax=Actinoplanes sp. NPDC049681 TaxID=3363905 RepID=UPI003798691F
MIGIISVATVRHRHRILLLGALMACGNALAVSFAPSVAQHLFLPLLAIVFAWVTMAILSLRIRPARFVLAPQVRGFLTPAAAWPVYLALSCLVPLSVQLGALMRAGRQEDLWWPEPIFDSPWLIIVALLVVEAWRGHGAQLRPEGVRQSYALGSLVIPWEAAPIAYLAPRTKRPMTLRLGYAEPQLVRRIGFPLSRHALRTDNVDATFLSAAIQHYVDHPEHRTAIGTQEEYRRLLAELSGSDGQQQAREVGTDRQADAGRIPQASTSPITRSGDV